MRERVKKSTVKNLQKCIFPVLLAFIPFCLAFPMSEGSSVKCKPSNFVGKSELLVNNI